MVAVAAMVLALLAAVWAIHNRGRTYPNASHQLPIVHLALPAAEPGLTAPTVTTDGTRFVKGGKPTVLQGYDLSVTGQSVYKNAAELNANFARITIAWSQVEPTKPTGDPSHLVHHWDSALLTELDQEVAGLGAQGIQVLIDFHQFHWSPYYAQLECKTGVAACHATGVPTWFYAGRYPQTKAGESAAKADFWDSERKTSLFYYAAFAEMMARRYGHDPNVIGYEIFNEPHPGHLPDSTSTTNAILAWQAQIYKVMHAVDPQRTMFVMCRGGAEGVGTADLDQFGSRPENRAGLPRLLQRRPRYRVRRCRRQLGAVVECDPQPGSRSPQGLSGHPGSPKRGASGADRRVQESRHTAARGRMGNPQGRPPRRRLHVTDARGVRTERPVVGALGARPGAWIQPARPDPAARAQLPGDAGRQRDHALLGTRSASHPRAE